MATNPVGWFEIYVEDMARATQFYESVLLVQLQRLESPDGSDMEMMAFPMSMDLPGASGALVRMSGFAPGGNGTIVYFSCEDCADEAGRVASAGGRVEQEKMAIGEYGFAAMARDSEGNMLGLHSMR